MLMADGVGNLCGSVPSPFTYPFPVLQEEVRQAVTPAEPVQYYFTLAQQPAAVQVQGQQQGQQTTTSTTTIQPGQIIIAQPQQGQVSAEQRSGALQLSAATETFSQEQAVAAIGLILFFPMQMKLG